MKVNPLDPRKPVKSSLTSHTVIPAHFLMNRLFKMHRIHYGAELSRRIEGPVRRHYLCLALTCINPTKKTAIVKVYVWSHCLWKLSKSEMSRWCIRMRIRKRCINKSRASSIKCNLEVLRNRIDLRQNTCSDRVFVYLSAVFNIVRSRYHFTNPYCWSHL